MTYVKDEMLNLAARMTDMSEDLISESDIRAGEPLLSKPKRAGRFSAFMNHPAMVAVLCAVVSLGVVAAIVMAGRGGPDVPPVVETPHVEDSETGTENEKETESEIELVYSEGLIFHKNGDGTYKITSIGTCTDTELVIPPTYEGLPVTAIGDSAFSDCTHLSAVVIPATVTAIGDMAFNGCASLVSVTIPESVITIGAGAFSHCTVLTSVTVPDGIRSVGFSAFEDCPNLQFNVFDKANYLGNEKNPYVALVRCPTRGASSCKVHEDTQLIAEEAFLNCEYLTSITIPDGINFIGARAFNGCSKLVYNTYSNAQYLGNEGNPYLVLVRATERNITSCEIHEATKLIGCHAFITVPRSGRYPFPRV